MCRLHHVPPPCLAWMQQLQHMGLPDGRQEQQEELILQCLRPNGIADLLAPAQGGQGRKIRVP